MKKPKNITPEFMIKNNRNFELNFKNIKISRTYIEGKAQNNMATAIKDVRKISLSSFDSSLNRVISINKNKLDTINTTINELKALIPTEHTHKERLFLISQLLNEELIHE